MHCTYLSYSSLSNIRNIVTYNLSPNSLYSLLAINLPAMPSAGKPAGRLYTLLCFVIFYSTALKSDYKNGLISIVIDSNDFTR